MLLCPFFDTGESKDEHDFDGSLGADKQLCPYFAGLASTGL